MPTIELRHSTLQAILISLCQGAALWALLSSAAPTLLRAGLGVSVLVQAVWPRIARRRSGGREPARQHLGLGATACRLVAAGESVELQPPVVRYLSEWLMIIEFRPQPAVSGYRAGGESRLLLLWPDSLSARDDWRLRRYLEARRGELVSAGVG